MRKKKLGMKRLDNLDVRKGDVDIECLGAGRARILRKRIEDNEDDPIESRRHSELDYENFTEADADYPTLRRQAEE